MEKLWERLPVKELTLTDTQTFAVGDLIHYQGTELYRVNKVVAVSNRDELIEHIGTSSITELHYPQWEKDKWYNKGALVYVKDMSDIYICIKANRLPQFNEYAFAPNNPFNPAIEDITSANFNFGLYAQAHGTKASLEKVPKHSALIYIADDEPGNAYIYIKANDNLSTREHFGWTPLKGISDGIITYKPVLVDNITVTGNGIKKPLTAHCSIPDYDEHEEYNAGRIVHATFDKVEGIYRAFNKIVVCWEEQKVKKIALNVSNLVVAGEYFEVRGLIEQQYNGFYKCSIPDGGISMILTPDNVTDFLDHLNHHRFYKIEEWQPNILYYQGMEVYNLDKVYICKCKCSQAIFKPLDDVINWQLLADISVASSKDRMPIGSMIMFVGNTLPAGWLWCLGQKINKHLVDAHGESQEGYPLLYNVIGGKYWEDEYKFKLPTADNMIIRAV